MIERSPLRRFQTFARDYDYGGLMPLGTPVSLGFNARVDVGVGVIVAVLVAVGVAVAVAVGVDVLVGVGVDGLLRMDGTSQKALALLALELALTPKMKRTV